MKLFKQIKNLLLQITLAVASLLPAGASAQPLEHQSNASQNNEHQVLIVIGYMDEVNIDENIKHLTQHKYLPQLGSEVENQIRNFLKIFTTETQTSVFKNKDKFKSTNLTLINTNVVCSGEEQQTVALRSRLCPQQIQQIHNTMTYLKTHLNQFDQLIYIGHSRKGLGLAIGPFQAESTFDMNRQFFNIVETGRLKKITMASCESNKLFKPLHRFFDVIGTNDKMYIFPDLMSLTLNEIKKIYMATENELPNYSSDLTK
jgi:hypothetical protein